MEGQTINNKLKNINNGNLYEYLKLGIQLKEEEVKVIFYKIIKIVQELHINKIYNLDLEPINIMLDKDYEPIIIDFPAPVSPDKIFNPSPNSTSASSINAKFFTCKFCNILSYSLSQYSSL